MADLKKTSNKHKRPDTSIDDVDEDNAIAENKPKHEMRPTESLIPENVDQKEHEQQEEVDRSNTIGASMVPRPGRQPKPELTPQQIKAAEVAKARSHQLAQQMQTAAIQSHNWRNNKRKMERIERTLGKDNGLRNAAYVVAGGAATFASMSPKDQMDVLKGTKNQIRTLTQNAVAAQNTLNPNDPTNLFNQANPTNLANQQQATNAAIILNQDDQVAQDVMNQDNQATMLNQSQENDFENNQQALELTAAEEAKVTEYNQEFNPSPQPSSNSEPDDEELKTGEEALATEAGVDAFKQAYEGFTSGDKEAMMDGMMGKEVTEGVLKEGVSVGMSLAKAAVAA